MSEADDRHGIPVGDPVLVRRKEAAQERFDSENREIISGYDGSLRLFRIPISDHVQGRGGVVRCEALEHSAVIAKMSVLRVAESQVRVRICVDGHKSVRILDR